jgi:hypothetical protein
MNQIQNILVIGFVWPEPNSSAAGTRMQQLLILFKQWGWKVTFATPAMESDFMIDLAAIGVEKKAIKLNCSSFDTFVQELNPTMVFFDRFLMTKDQILNFLHLLRPIDLNIALSRLGSINDGGYLVPSNFSDEIDTCFSLGIGSNDSFDLDCVINGINVHQFDPTIENPPHSGDLLNFYPKAFGMFQKFAALFPCSPQAPP